MQSAMRKRVFRTLAVLCPVALTALTGCGIGVQQLTEEASTQVTGRALNGHVHGGAFPIQKAYIHLLETQNKGYGGQGKDLLAPLGITVQSDQNGNFNIPDSTWTCDSGQYAYLTVTGGYTVNLGTTTPNNDVIQVVAIGPCSDLATSGSGATINRDTINIFASELSTVAAAYALGNFISIDSTGTAGQQVVNISTPANNNAASPACTGTGTSMSCTSAGLAHAFANAAMLVDAVRFDNSSPTGKPLLVNANNSNSTLPLQMVNTIGNILQSCVDSIGGAGCGNLFKWATPPSGKAPTNTLQAALNMAKYPTNQVANLFSLQPKQAFFTPDMDAAPTSYSLTIYYGIAPNPTSTLYPYPVDVALDSADNVYLLYGSASPSAATVTGVSALHPNGTIFGKQTANFGYPSQIAVDANANIYWTNNDNSTGAILRGTSSSGFVTVATLPYASGLAVDTFNNVWGSADNTASSSNAINEYASGSVSTTKSAIGPTFSTGSVGAPVAGLAIDNDQNIWGVSNPASGVSRSILVNNYGSTTSPTYSGSAVTLQKLGAGGGFSVALTPGTSTSGSAYFPISGETDYITGSAGQNGSIAGVLTAGGTTAAAASVHPNRSEVDGSGNVFWTDLESTGQLFMLTPSSSPTTTAGSTISFLPCYIGNDGSGYSCLGPSTFPANLRGMAIDSSGDVWMGVNSSYGALIEVLGLAAPTWPQLSYGNPGSAPK